MTAGETLRRRWAAGLALGVFAVYLVPLRRVHDVALYPDWRVHTDLAEEMADGPPVQIAHFLFHWLAIAAHAIVRGISWRAASVLVASGAVAATVALCFWVLSAVIDPPRRALAAVLSLAVVVAGPVSLLALADHRLYLGYIVTSTLHNPTTILARPLALLAFIAVVPMLDGRPSQSGRRQAAAAAVLVLSTLAKPSFTLCLLPALVGVALAHRRRLGAPAMFRLAAVLGLCGSVMVWQQRFAFTQETGKGGGIAFSPLEVVSSQADHIALRLVLSLLFPLVVMLVWWREVWADTWMQVAWASFGFGAAAFYLLIETGLRAGDGNFGWSAQLTLFVLFVVSARFVVRQGAQGARTKQVLPLLVLGAHAAAGMVFFFVYALAASDRPWL